VLINDVGASRVWIADSTLRQVGPLGDATGSAWNPYTTTTIFPGGLIGSAADTSLFLDPVSSSMAVIGPKGNLVASTALPPLPPGAPMFPGSAVARLLREHTPAWSEALGLLYQEGPLSPRWATVNLTDTVVVTVEDSAALLAMNLRTRMVDTVAKLALGTVRTHVILPGLHTGSGSNVPTFAPTGDSWAIVADGSIAILHGREYRLSWISPTGSRSTSPPIPYAWMRLSTTDKQRMSDSANSAEERAYQTALLRGRADSAAGRPYYGLNGLSAIGRPGRTGPVAATPPKRYDYEDVPDYVSPFVPGRRMLFGDEDNNLWIRRGRVLAVEPELYDVVNRRGELVDRVRLPAGLQLIGFGPGGFAYVIGFDGGKEFLARVRVR
jgi:hypothetical protein